MRFILKLILESTPVTSYYERIGNMGTSRICIQVRHSSLAFRARDFIFDIIAEQSRATCTSTHAHHNRWEKKARVKRKRKIARARSIKAIGLRLAKKKPLVSTERACVFSAPNKHLSLALDVKKKNIDNVYASVKHTFKRDELVA